MIKMTDSEKLKKLNDDVTEVIVMSRLIDDLRHRMNNSIWLLKKLEEKSSEPEILEIIKKDYPVYKLKLKIKDVNVHTARRILSKAIRHNKDWLKEYERRYSKAYQDLQDMVLQGKSK